jgi:uncharacterized membrane protein (GlpM family)
MDLLFRFLVGGLVISAFAALGDVLMPKSFAGLFGAAPSVAIATLALTSYTQGKLYAAVEASTMVAGAIAFFIYACCVSSILRRCRVSVLLTATLLLPLWFASALVLWVLWFKGFNV